MNAPGTEPQEFKSLKIKAEGRHHRHHRQDGKTHHSAKSKTEHKPRTQTPDLDRLVSKRSEDLETVARPEVTKIDPLEAKIELSTDIFVNTTTSLDELLKDPRFNNIPENDRKNVVKKALEQAIDDFIKDLKGDQTREEILRLLQRRIEKLGHQRSSPAPADQAFLLTYIYNQVAPRWTSSAK